MELLLTCQLFHCMLQHNRITMPTEQHILCLIVIFVVICILRCHWNGQTSPILSKIFIAVHDINTIECENKAENKNCGAILGKNDLLCIIYDIYKVYFILSLMWSIVFVINTRYFWHNRACNWMSKNKIYIMYLCLMIKEWFLAFIVNWNNELMNWVSSKYFCHIIQCYIQR